MESFRQTSSSEFKGAGSTKIAQQDDIAADLATGRQQSLAVKGQAKIEDLASWEVC